MDSEAIEKLAIRCVAHLQQEEAMLRETLRIEEATRESLLHRDGDRLRVSVEQQQHTAEASQELRRKREELRAEIAQTLNIPAHAATVSKLANSSTGETAKELRTSRQNLNRMAARIQTLHRANAVLALKTNHMVIATLQKLTGEQLFDVGYAKTGERKRSTGPGWIDTET